MSLLGPAIAIMAIVGAIFGAGLAFASHKFAVEVDPRVTDIRAVLAGANCGGCGFPGCDGFAEAVVAGTAPVDGCKPAGNKAAEAIASIMGMSVDLAAEPKIANVQCNGGCDLAVIRSNYVGIQDCKAAQMASAGGKGCTYGCLGYGTCVASCPFGAMSMGEDGIPTVDPEKCTGCGNCVKVCPRQIIDLAGASRQVHVRCKNKDRGVAVRKLCKVGCIACQMCVKVCPTKAMQFGNNLAYINYDLCNNCGTCAAKCPTKAIEDLQKKQDKQAVSA